MLLTAPTIQELYKPRAIASEKRDFGHVLLMGGSYGMIGAVTLAAKAALRCGAGLVTVLTPKCGYIVVQTTVPEAMVLASDDDEHLEYLPDISNYTILAIGPGLGTSKAAANFIDTLLHLNRPMIIDADALNIIAAHEWQYRIPKGSVITPHKREFARLFGETSSEKKRHHLQKEKANDLGIYIVLKEPRVRIVCPNGDMYHNTTGNSGMAKGGSGDVLTGIIAGLAGRLNKMENAVLMGVFIHGLAGDMAANQYHLECMLPEDMIACLPHAFKQLWPQRD